MSKFDSFLEKCLLDPYVAKFIKDNNVSDEVIRTSRNEIIKYVTYDNDAYDKSLELNRNNIYCYIKNNNLKYSDVNYKFESSVPYMEQVEIYPVKERKEVFDFMANIYSGKFDRGIYLCGIPGTGKTTMMKYLARRLFLSGRDVLFLKFPSLVTELKSKIENGDYKYLVDKIKKTDVVILDDFSIEAFDSTWLRNEIMFSILDYRSEHNKLTLFTSNFPLAEFEKEQPNMIERLRLLERIKILAKYIELKDKSYRKY